MKKLIIELEELLGEDLSKVSKDTEVYAIAKANTSVPIEIVSELSRLQGSLKIVTSDGSSAETKAFLLGVLSATLGKTDEVTVIGETNLDHEILKAVFPKTAYKVADSISNLKNTKSVKATQAKKKPEKKSLEEPTENSQKMSEKGNAVPNVTTPVADIQKEEIPFDDTADNIDFNSMFDEIPLPDENNCITPPETPLPGEESDSSASKLTTTDSKESVAVGSKSAKFDDDSLCGKKAGNGFIAALEAIPCDELDLCKYADTICTSISAAGQTNAELKITLPFQLQLRCKGEMIGNKAVCDIIYNAIESSISALASLI